MTTRFSSHDLNSLTKEQVLRFSTEDRQAYFHQIRLRHPSVSQALADLKLLSKPGVGSDITLLIGPTGVGKSTVIDTLREQVLKENEGRMREDLAMIPIAVTEAPASGERGFAWRIFYQRLGEALQEPLMSKKQETVLKDGRITVKPVSTSSTVAALRMASEKALIYRSTSIVVVDEAVHLLRHQQGNAQANHMDALKSLANICGVNIILAGSYDLLKLINMSAQFARRTTIVHFPRYLTGEKEDEKHFAGVVKKLATYLPLEEEVDLSPFATDLHHACLGCVGILKSTLTRALAISLMSGGKWKKEYLEQALLSPMQQRVIFEEILDGEKKMSDHVFGVSSFKSSSSQYKVIELEMGVS